VEAIVEPAGTGQADTQPVARRRDDQVRAQFVATYTTEYPRLVAFVLRRTGSRQVAEDVTAEVFRIAWEQADGTLSTGWLFVTARNLVLAHYRSIQRTDSLRRRLVNEVATQPSATSIESTDDRVLVALDRLPEQQRELLTAHYWDGLSGADCAALAGCSVGAVWVRLHRARAALRVELEKLKGEPPCE
jgi:RNA polymerase sigma-70 factor (ECF subfamily)